MKQLAEIGFLLWFIWSLAATSVHTTMLLVLRTGLYILFLFYANRNTTINWWMEKDTQQHVRGRRLTDRHVQSNNSAYPSSVNMPRQLSSNVDLPMRRGAIVWIFYFNALFMYFLRLDYAIRVYIESGWCVWVKRLVWLARGCFSVCVRVAVFIVFHASDAFLFVYSYQFYRRYGCTVYAADTRGWSGS